MADPGPFERHVREAIALNRARRPGYVARGGARAALISRMLVGSERALLPLARRVDRRAERLRQSDDLVAALMPMHDAPPPDRLVSGAKRGATVCARLAVSLAGPLARIDRALRQRDHAEAARLTADLLRRLRQSAEAGGLRLAMATHLAESATLAASRAEGARVLGTFARLHLHGMPLALTLDALAAPLHARGVGILANDLPPIPAP